MDRYTLLIAISTLIFTLLSQEASYSQDRAPGYSMQQWTIEDGLPVNSVNDIIQAKSGYLWMATSSGLLRFDGINFKIYSSTDYPGLEGNRILKIEESNDGSILMLNQGADIFVLRDEEITKLSSANQGIFGTIGDLFKDDKGKVWYPGVQGLFVYEDGSSTRFEPTIIDKPVSKVYKIQDGVIWFKYLDDNMLYKYEGGGIKAMVDSSIKEENEIWNGREGWFYIFTKGDEEWISTPNAIYLYNDGELTLEYEMNQYGIYSMLVDKDGNINVSVAHTERYRGERILLKLEKGRLIQSEPEGFSRPVKQSFIDSSGSFWIVTADKLFRDNEIIYSTENNIDSFLIDKEGNIWLGTVADGLVQLQKNLITTWNEKDGIPNNTYSLFETSDSVVWVGSFGQGIAKIKNGVGIENIPIENGIAHVLTMNELQDGTFLIGGLGRGIAYYDKNKNAFIPYPTFERIGSQNVRSIFEDSKQRLWVGTSPLGERGLFVRRYGEWEALAGKENIPYAAYQFITETPRGDIWMAARGEGLVRYDGSKYYHYSKEDGFTSDFIRALYAYIDKETGEEILLIGSEGDGIDRITLVDGNPDFSTLTLMNKRNGLFDNSIHIILEDDFERLWMNTNQGIFWINKSDVAALHKGEIKEIMSTSYTEDDGLMNREGNGGSQPSGIKSRDGKLWFPGQGGVANIDPKKIQQNTTPPPVHVQELVYGNERVPIISGRVDLKANQRDFEISYAALSFKQSKKNQYRYILEGASANWQEVGTRNIAYFTNVPSGKYTFTVQGSNNDGVWNTKGASIVIIIAPYFYETPWFYLIFGFLIIGVIFWGISHRERQNRKKQLELENIIRERTEDLTKEKEEVEHQKAINDELSTAKDHFFTNISHELRTPLTMVLGPLQSLDEEESFTEKSKRNLKLAQRNGLRLKQLVEQVLDLSRMDSSKIELDLIKLDVRAMVKLLTESFESLANRKGIKLILEIPNGKFYGALDSDRFQKILVNLISNAIKFTPSGGEIRINVVDKDETIVLTISDTGLGIEPEQLPYIFHRFHSNEKRIAGGGNGLGVGLNLTKEFVELHKGTIEVESEVGKGTTFKVTLPNSAHTMSKLDHDVPDEEAMPVYEAPQSIIPLVKKGEGKITNVLLVEDNSDMRAYISEVLQDKNIEITQAASGIEGKKQLSLMIPDLIISDVMMPDMDGFEFAQYVRSVPEYRLTPIVMLTALAGLEERLHAFGLGVSDYVAKPFEKRELKVRVHNLLRLKAERDQSIAKSEPEEERLSEGSEFVRQLQNYIKENLSNTHLNVEELGDVVNMSRRKLYRKLKHETGFTPGELLKEIRLLNARQLIEGKRLQSIAEVSYAVGFSTPSYFARVYKERFGTHPSSLI